MQCDKNFLPIIKILAQTHQHAKTDELSWLSEAFWDRSFWSVFETLVS